MLSVSYCNVVLGNQVNKPQVFALCARSTAEVFFASTVNDDTIDLKDFIFLGL